MDPRRYYQFLSDEQKPLEQVDGCGRIFKDGNAWCVYGPRFIDPVVSAFGCGDTPREAYERWANDAVKRPEWEERPLPKFADFIIE